MFGQLGFPELIVILVILLLLFGARRLPELAQSLGQSIRSFKKGMSEAQLEDRREKSTPAETPPVAEKAEADR
ncbi:MAG: twin-arginine translocase TatA/TatE family subunit [Acidobacteria bacterium]|nr:MAG: twin-arginine translocase TatA/TatE family subunit [Acidobacteriota bacterium]